MAGASAAAVVCVAGFLWRANQDAAPSVASPVNSALVVVRQAKQTLPDGSVVELKDGARISTDFSGPERAVSLWHGTAYFQVAKDPRRPFVVRAGGLTVQAVGTAFATELTDRGEQLTVLVTEGRVRVDVSSPSPAAPAAPRAEPLVSVEAGKSVVLPAAAPTADRLIVRAVDDAELQEQIAWRIPKLEFTATRLREIAAQMNQHNRRQLVLGDESVGDLRVSGVLRADKMDTLAEMLENDFGVHAERRAGEIIVRRTK